MDQVMLEQRILKLAHHVGKMKLEEVTFYVRKQMVSFIAFSFE